MSKTDQPTWTDLIVTMLSWDERPHENPVTRLALNAIMGEMMVPTSVMRTDDGEIGFEWREQDRVLYMQIGTIEVDHDPQ